MSEVGRPLAEVREHRRLDGLDSFRLLGVVGDAVLGAVGVRDEERALAVVAAAKARRHRRRLFAFFLPRRNASRRRLVQASLRDRFVCAAASLLDRRTFTRRGRGIRAVVGSFTLTEQGLNWQSAVRCARCQAKSLFFAGVLMQYVWLKSYF